MMPSHHEGQGVSGLGWIICNGQSYFQHSRMIRKFQGCFRIKEAECKTLVWAYTQIGLSVSSMWNSKVMMPQNYKNEITSTKFENGNDSLTP